MGHDDDPLLLACGVAEQRHLGCSAFEGAVFCHAVAEAAKHVDRLFERSRFQCDVAATVTGMAMTVGVTRLVAPDEEPLPPGGEGSCWGSCPAAAVDRPSVRADRADPHVVGRGTLDPTSGRSRSRDGCVVAGHHRWPPGRGPAGAWGYHRSRGSGNMVSARSSCRGVMATDGFWRAAGNPPARGRQKSARTEIPLVRRPVSGRIGSFHPPASPGCREYITMIIIVSIKTTRPVQFSITALAVAIHLMMVGSSIDRRTGRCLACRGLTPDRPRRGG